MFMPILIAFFSMICTDILGVVMVMAEARNKGWLAGWMDAAQYLVSIACTTIMVTILQGHTLEEKIIALSAITVANVLGTRMGSAIGNRVVRDATSLADRVARLEDLNPQIHDRQGH